MKSNYSECIITYKQYTFNGSMHGHPFNASSYFSIAFSKLIHDSFIQSISMIYPFSSPQTTQRRSRHSTDTVSEFHAEAPQAIASEGLAKGPYVAVIEPPILRLLHVV